MNSKNKTTRTSHSSPLYQFTVMPFGLCNAPQRNCRLIYWLVRNYFQERVLVYLDDLLVTSSALEEILSLFQKVSWLWILRNLTKNVEKIKFVLKEVRNLGYIVGIKNMETPHCIHLEKYWLNSTELLHYIALILCIGSLMDLMELDWWTMSVSDDSWSRMTCCKGSCDGVWSCNRSISS